MAAKLKKSEDPMAHARMQETMQALFLEPEKYILPELGMVLYVAPNQKVKDGMKQNSDKAIRYGLPGFCVFILA